MVPTSISATLSQHRPMLQDNNTVSRGMPVYFPAVAGTHCAYPERDGQAE